VLWNPPYAMMETSLFRLVGREFGDNIRIFSLNQVAEIEFQRVLTP